jgi:inorganic pyrophosphatase
LDLVDEDQCDHKVLAVPEREPRSASILDLDGMPKHYLREIEHFFRIYKELEQKQSRIEGWRNAGAARALIQESRTRFLGRTNAGKTISAMP